MSSSGVPGRILIFVTFATLLSWSEVKFLFFIVQKIADQIRHDHAEFRVMVRYIYNIFTAGRADTHDESREPLDWNQQLPFPVKGLAVHAAELIVDHASDAAPCELERPAVLKVQVRHGAVLLVAV